MAERLSGRWKLMNEHCSSQREVLKLMGRKPWEISVIDKADEYFDLLHFTKQMPDHQSIHFFDKFVIISLDSKFLHLLSKAFTEIDKVKYSHKLVANNVEKKHENDEKHFGVCASRTTWEKDHSGHQGFTIRWFIARGILKVFHFVNEQDQLVVEMEMTLPSNRSAKCTKIYGRTEFTHDMQNYIDNHPYKEHFVSPK